MNQSKCQSKTLKYEARKSIDQPTPKMTVAADTSTKLSLTAAKKFAEVGAVGWGGGGFGGLAFLFDTFPPYCAA